MRVWLLLAVLILPAVQGQSGALDLTIVEQEFGYGPENWKQGVPEDERFREQMGPWSASLGAYVDLTVDVYRSGAATPTLWDYKATLSDGTTTVDGLVEVIQTGQLGIRFDVDGQRAIAGLSAVQPLGSGDWTLRIVATSANGLATRPEGSGLTTMTAGSVSFEQLGGVPLVGVGVPEDILPHIREVGAGPNTWMPLQATNYAHPAIVSAEPGTDLFWSEWVAEASSAAVASGTSAPIPTVQTPDPFSGTPLAGADAPLDVTTKWSRIGGGVTTTDETGFSSYFVGLKLTQQALVVVTVHAPDAGGAASFVVGFTAQPHVITDIVAAEPGQEGMVQVTAMGPAPSPAGGPLPATIQALSQTEPLTTGKARGGSVESAGLLLPSGSNTWQGGYDGTQTRAAGISSAVILAFFQDPFGNYAGHTSAVRGLNVSLDAPLLGVGKSTDLNLIINHVRQNDGIALGHTVPARFDVSFAQEPLGSAEIEVPSDGEVVKKFALTPSSAGSKPATVLVDTGDLRFEIQRTFDVLDSKAYKDATAPWYDTPAPPIAPLLVLLGLLVLRKREI